MTSATAAGRSPEIAVETRRRARGSLTRDEVVAAAAAIVRRDGLDSFSMRRLGAELRVNPMTVYRVLDGRDAVLAAVAADLVGDLDLPPDEGTWHDRAVGLAVAVRSHLLSIRDLARLFGGADDALAPAMLRVTERGLALMVEIGLDGDDAVEAFRALFWHAVGSAMADDSVAAGHPDRLRSLAGAARDEAPVFASLQAHFGPVDRDRLFERSTRALLAGLAATAPNPPAEAP